MRTIAEVSVPARSTKLYPSKVYRDQSERLVLGIWLLEEVDKRPSAKVTVGVSYRAY